MPELPEVETIVRQLDRALSGRVFEQVEVLREKSAQSELKELMGKKISGVRRFAKYIHVELEGEDMGLLIHLKMTGQLIFDENDQVTNSPAERGWGNLQINSKFQNPNTKKGRKGRIVGGHPTKDWVGELPSKHTRIIARFKGGSRLFFNDQRVFGWWKVVTRDKLKKTRNKLPPDVVDFEFTVEYLAGVLDRSSRAVKLVILDQTKMGGMGNIYANDALWLAEIRPDRLAKKVKKKEVLKLHEAMVEVLSKGIELGGASYSNFVDTEGLGGSYQEHFVTYDREGEKCLRDGCGGVIEKMKLGGRGTYFCRKCQK